MGKERFVCVYASNVAACIGLNQYKMPHEAFEDMWRKLDSASYEAALQRNNALSKDQEIQQVLKENEELAKTVRRATEKRHDHSSQTTSTVDDVSSAIRALNLAPEKEKIVQQHAQSAVFTKYGIGREEAVYQRLAEMGLDLEKYAFFKKKRIGEVGGVPWYIGGKIDAITTDKKCIVEIKNRVRKLFGKVVEYENIQIQTYMHAFDVDHARLAECFTDRDRGMSIQVHAVERDPELWEKTIMPRLTEFVTRLLGLLDDAKAQDDYFEHRTISYE